MAQVQLTKAEAVAVSSSASKESVAAHVRAALQALHVQAAAVEAAVKQVLLGMKHEVGVTVTEVCDMTTLSLDVVTEFPLQLAGACNWEFQGKAHLISPSSTAEAARTTLRFNDLHDLVTRGNRFATSGSWIFFCDAKAGQVLGVLELDPPTRHTAGEGAWRKI